jgi:hypothetical protein
LKQKEKSKHCRSISKNSERRKKIKKDNNKHGCEAFLLKNKRGKMKKERKNK